MTHTDDRENVYRKDDGGMQSMTLIAKLDELPSSAASFAAVMKHKNELVELIRQSRGASMNDTADIILKWISGRGKA